MSWCTCGRPSENPIKGGDCATCKHENRKACRKAVQRGLKFEKAKRKRDPILKVSGKMKKALGEYSRIKKGWINGKRCAVLPQYEATDVHHMKGRVGFADQWAREKDIPLLIDIRFWLPVSRAGHNQIELNTAWALEKGYSLGRNEIILK